MGPNHWQIQFGLNTTINKTTNKTPYELLLGYRPRQASDSFLSAEVCTTNYDSDLTKTREKTSQRIVDKQDQQKMQYDAKRKAAPEFRVGQRVLVRKVIPANDGKSRKLLQKYSGPYEILKRLDSDHYVVRELPGSTRSRRPYETHDIFLLTNLSYTKR